MAPITVMQRHELKYKISAEQVEFLKQNLKDYVTEDKFGFSKIMSLYYDTPDYRLIRTSIEKPLFKEKIRLRSYGLATQTSPVFLEIKRKIEGVVYKRRVQTTVKQSNDFFAYKGEISEDTQIARELKYFRDYYKTLAPACLIMYDRLAYKGTDGIRITIDYDIKYRITDLSLDKSVEGNKLLDDGSSILEIKAQGAYPLWLVKILEEGKIYKTGFTKYGTVYKNHIINIHGKVKEDGNIQHDIHVGVN